MLIALIIGPNLQAEMNCKSSSAPLFQSELPIELKLKADFNHLNNPDHSIFKKKILKSDGFISYQQENNQSTVTIKTTVTPRGTFRFNNCEVRPINLRISKEEKSRINHLDGNNPFKKIGRKLKVVNVCNPTSDTLTLSETLILKEYYIYKIAQLFIPTALNVRLAKIKYIKSGDTPLFEAYAILLEPKKRARKRCQMEKEPDFLLDFDNDSDLDSRIYITYDQNGINPPPVDHPTSTFRVQLFNQFVGNGDYEVVVRHNLISMMEKNGNIHLTPYDFDSVDFILGYGFQDKIFEEWILEEGIKQPKLLNSIGQDFLQKQNAIQQIIDQSLLNSQSKEELSSWLKRASGILANYIDRN